MMRADDFLDAYDSIDEHQAEYSILLNLYKTCPEKLFLFEMKEIEQITRSLGEVSKFINENTKSYELSCFSLDIDNHLSYTVVSEQAGSSMKDEDFFNIALELSRKNGSYILVRSPGAYVLFCQGEFDRKFESRYVDREKLIKMEQEKIDIDHLELAFDQFRVERRHKGCDYIINGKVDNEVSEQQLRNHLVNYLKRVTNLYVVTELCTSQTEDEESVDIGLINSNQAVAIIEVKYFVQKKFFINPKKEAYTQSRFKDGYEQLNRYCEHLDTDNYSLHSAYLYMFFAHSASDTTLRDSAKHYYADFTSSKECSNNLKYHYKNTILDRIVDISTST